MRKSPRNGGGKGELVALTQEKHFLKEDDFSRIISRYCILYCMGVLARHRIGGKFLAKKMFNSMLVHLHAIGFS